MGLLGAEYHFGKQIPELCERQRGKTMDSSRTAIRHEFMKEGSDRFKILKELSGLVGWWTTTKAFEHINNSLEDEDYGKPKVRAVCKSLQEDGYLQRIEEPEDGHAYKYGVDGKATFVVNNGPEVEITWSDMYDIFSE